MRKSRFSEEQIIAILAEQERGMGTAEVCRRHGISPVQSVGDQPGRSGGRIKPQSPAARIGAGVRPRTLPADVRPDTA